MAIPEKLRPKNMKTAKQWEEAEASANREGSAIQCAQAILNKAEKLNL
jgi:hypothetical protein